MRNNAFGWSLPAGCSKLPGEETDNCMMCGALVEFCECPECPVCHMVGDPFCYANHQLQKTPTQLEAEKKMDESLRQESEYMKRMDEELNAFYDSLESDWNDKNRFGDQPHY